MTIHEFKEYQLLADKVIDLLIKEKHSSINDIKIIYNIIMRFPYCLDKEGHYTYEGKWYDSRKELPDYVQEQIMDRVKNCTTFLQKMIDGT